MFRIYSGLEVGTDHTVDYCHGKLWPRTLPEGITLGQYVPPGHMPKESLADIIVYLVCSECGVHFEAKDEGMPIDALLKPQIAAFVNPAKKPTSCGHEGCEEKDPSGALVIGGVTEGSCRMLVEGRKAAQVRTFLYCRRLLLVMWVDPL